MGDSAAIPGMWHSTEGKSLTPSLTHSPLAASSTRSRKLLLKSFVCFQNGDHLASLPLGVWLRKLASFLVNPVLIKKKGWTISCCWFPCTHPHTNATNVLSGLHTIHEVLSRYSIPLPQPFNDMSCCHNNHHCCCYFWSSQTLLANYICGELTQESKPLQRFLKESVWPTAISTTTPYLQYVDKFLSREGKYGAVRPVKAILGPLDKRNRCLPQEFRGVSLPTLQPPPVHSVHKYGPCIHHFEYEI